MFASFYFYLSTVILSGFFLPCTGLDKPTKPSQKTTKVAQYYTKDNLAMLQSKKAQLHAPCMIIIDFNETINLSVPDANISTLFIALHQGGFPVIVATSLLKNLLNIVQTPTAKPNPLTDLLKTTSNFFIADKWDIYRSSNNVLMLLVPKLFSSVFAQKAFAFENLKNLSHLLPESVQGTQKITTYDLLLKELQSSPNVKSSPESFIDIFTVKNPQLPQQTLIWDFFCTGHGNLGTNETARIVGFSPSDLNRFLNTIDKKLDAGIIYLLSCNAGGKNLTLLQAKENGFTSAHNFILIVGATTDAPVVVTDNFDLYRQFFNAAAQLLDRGVSLNNVINTLTRISWPFSKGPYTILHGVEKIPQVWLPNGMGFQTIDLDTFIYVIKNVKAFIAQENRKPLVIENKQAVLVYPKVVQATVTISPVQQKTLKAVDPKTWLQISEKLWENMPMLSENIFWKSVSLIEKPQLLATLVKDYPSVKLLPAEYDNPFLFPQIISMKKQDHLCYFKQIVLRDTIATAGVMRFIRDAFLDIGGRTVPQTFLIDDLTGYNDLSLLLQASRLVKGVSELHEIETLLADQKDKNITLKNIFIKTSYDVQEQRNYFSITFTIGTTAWSCTQDSVQEWSKSYWWNFSANKRYETHKAVFDAMKKRLLSEFSGQMNISDAIEKKMKQ